MTREEAITVLKAFMENPLFNDVHKAAFNIAIHDIKQEPCGDCISRDVVIDVLKEMWNKYSDANDAMQESIATIEALQPVTPQPRTGEWLEKEVIDDKVIKEWQSARCSVCDRYHTTPYMYYFSHYNYCPHCGCRMEGRQKVDKRRSKRNR